MDTDPPLVIPLVDAHRLDESKVGGKAATLSRLIGAGFRVPGGLSLTTAAYDEFVARSRIQDTIHMEIGRKRLEDARWEEIWDAALRIRSAFLHHPLDEALRDAIRAGLRSFNRPLVVRSSAPGEDSEDRSFAGIHESVIGVSTDAEIWDAIRQVWASLWSDAALLYRRELQLDPARSRMAVVVQEMFETDRSGVAFGRDPREAARDAMIIEAVPGLCRLLVDGDLDPDRWEVERSTRRVLSWVAGHREGDEDSGAPLLESKDIGAVVDAVLSIESLFGWGPDIEWTGRSTFLTILQARPISTHVDTDERRRWYLSLRPGDARLHALRKRVANELIPQLQAEGQRLAGEPLESLDDGALAAAIEHRQQRLGAWKKIYWDEFIPFAHGVRRLAVYYNDAIKPEDPYEFVGLLRDQPLLATLRNQAVRDLAVHVAGQAELRRVLEDSLAREEESFSWPAFRTAVESLSGGRVFVDRYQEMSQRFMDIAYDHHRLQNDATALLKNILELASTGGCPRGRAVGDSTPQELEDRLLAAVGSDRHDEARQIIEVGRISWRLRDDDNLLVSRIESQLLRSLEVAAERLKRAGRLKGEAEAGFEDVELIVAALRDRATSAVTLHVKSRPESPSRPIASGGEAPRQLVGQPASPGVATGRVHCIQTRHDLGAFRGGEVLVCDAIQPTMTHLIPLASAIVERRGGMLIHGAIIARELGIPCVNGVRDAVTQLADGDLVSVDGHLGIVSVGEPDFDLEFAPG